MTNNSNHHGRTDMTITPTAADRAALAAVYASAPRAAAEAAIEQAQWERDEARRTAFIALDNPTPEQWTAEAKALNAIYGTAFAALEADGYNEAHLIIDKLVAETNALWHYLAWQHRDRESYEMAMAQWGGVVHALVEAEGRDPKTP